MSRTLADLAEALRLPQESAGRGRVVLDRRVAERRVAERRAAAAAVERERRRSDRRRAPAGAADALMRVLGFMVVPGAKAPGEVAKRRTGKQSVRAPHTPGRSRRAAPGHRARRRRP